MVESTPPQQHVLIPDITIVYGSQTYTIIEAAKTDNDTKQFVATYKKCPEIMAQVLGQLVKKYPSQQRNINKVYGSFLSQATCSPPLMLSNPFGYVKKVVSHGKKLSHPEVTDTFKPDMAALLEHFWGLKLTMEAMLMLYRRVNMKIANSSTNKNLVVYIIIHSSRSRCHLI